MVLRQLILLAPVIAQSCTVTSSEIQFFLVSSCLLFAIFISSSCGFHCACICDHMRSPSCHVISCSDVVSLTLYVVCDTADVIIEMSTVSSTFLWYRWGSRYEESKCLVWRESNALAYAPPSQVEP